MINYTITIAVDPDDVIPEGGTTGNFVYTPALLRVTSGDTITWKSDHPFVLTFKAGTPVDDIELVGSHEDDNYTTGAQTVLGDKGHYHYAVALWNGSRVFIDAACPHISVN
jgi:plastocyanin